MKLIGRYRNPGYESVADAVGAFFERRSDLQRPGVAFGPEGEREPAKVSTDISLVAIDRSDPEAFALSQLIERGVSAGLQRYLQERPRFEIAVQNRTCSLIRFSTRSITPRGRGSSGGIAIGPSVMRPQNPHRCWPGFFIATVLMRPEPSSIGRSTMSRQNAGSY